MDLKEKAGVLRGLHYQANDAQCERIRAICAAAGELGVPEFVANARIDVYRITHADRQTCSPAEESPVVRRSSDFTRRHIGRRGHARAGGRRRANCNRREGDLEKRLHRRQRRRAVGDLP
jgi:hypothetical protein